MLLLILDFYLFYSFVPSMINKKVDRNQTMKDDNRYFLRSRYLKKMSRLPSFTTHPALFDSVTYEPLTEPVTAPCGHSLNRTTYLQVLASNPLCPTCRARLPHTVPAVNITLRDMVTTALSGDGTSGGATGPSGAPAAGVSIALRVRPDPITLRATKKEGRVHLSFNTTEIPEATLPTLFYLVVDNSGSMAEASANAATTVGSDASLLSRSALVRHSVASLIKIAGPRDMLALCAFHSDATILLRPTRMDDAGKARAETKLPLIRPDGGTNIWTALWTVLEDIKSSAPPPDYNVCVIFQTDGESVAQYDPPRGILQTFESWLDRNQEIKARLSVHTIGYGFGSRLDMPLLKRIAELGGGTVNYVPDGSMLGTVIIHLTANLMNCHYRGVTARLRPTGPGDVSTGFLPIGFLQGGQSRDFLVTAGGPFEITVYTGTEDTVFAVDPAGLEEVDDSFQRARQTLIEQILMGLSSPSAVTEESLFAAVAAHMSPTDSGGITALLTDVRDAAPTKGQIGKAFTGENFGRWGRHYLSGYLCGLQNQWPINFRDETSKIFGSASVRRAVDRGDEIFLTLPPPVADVPQAPPPSSYRAGGAGGPPTASPSTVVRMSSISNSSGPCFTDGQVTMENGHRKEVADIRAGDRLEGGHIVRCVIKTEIDGTNIVRLGDGPKGGWTIWHPVLQLHNKWEHPANLGPIVASDAKALYNFVLWTGHYIRLNGVQTCTMAHEFTGDAVIEHPYFGKRVPGKRNILDDLQASPGFNDGYVVWSNVRIEYEDGVIRRMIPRCLEAA